MNLKSSPLSALALALGAALSLAGCGGGGEDASTGGSDGGTSGTTYTVGGSITGLSGTIALQLNGGTALSVNANGSFAFTNTVASGTTYQVTIQTQPTGQTCIVGNSAGSALANVTNVTVTCAVDKYTVAGTLSGLSGTVVLRNNSADDLTLTQDGPFQFATGVTSFNAYNVTVQTQPTGQTCWVENGFDYASAPVTGVRVTCAASTSTATVGGGITGLSSAGLVLRLSQNGVVVESTSALAAGATSFAFAKALSTGNSWLVSIGTQPTSPRQTCTVSSGSGYIGAASVSNVQVACATDTYRLGGTIAAPAGGLAAGLVLQNNLGNDLAVEAGASRFTFPGTLTSPSFFGVSIKQQPAGQTCTLGGARGLVVAADVTDVELRCVAGVPASPLQGLYRISEGGTALRGFIAFSAGGTYVAGLHRESAQACNSGTGSTNGNGVEYGVYDWDAASGQFRIINAVVDTNDKCGMAGNAVLASGTLQRSADGSLAGTLVLPAGSTSVVLAPVALGTGQLLGGWTQDQLGFVLYGSDNTLFAAHSQAMKNQPALQAGIEDGCLSGAVTTAASGSYTVNLGSGCSVASGLNAVDTNGSGGLSATAGVATSFTVTGDSLSTQPAGGNAQTWQRIAAAQHPPP
ncbi:MAG: hypothetical protein RL026_625 [Pseudomonadota bacterium]